MQAFTDFILEIMYPPNPIRNLDNSLTRGSSSASISSSAPRPSSIRGSTGSRRCRDAVLWRLPCARPQRQRRLDHQARVLRLQHPVRRGRNALATSRPRTCATCIRRSASSASLNRRVCLPSPGPGSSVVSRSVASASPTMAASTPPSPSASRRTSGKWPGGPPRAENLFPPFFGIPINNPAGHLDAPLAPHPRGARRVHDGLRVELRPDRRPASHPDR